MKMYLEPKVNRTQVSSAEMPRKLCGWLAESRHVDVQRVSSRFEEM